MIVSNTWERPEIKIPKTKLEWMLDFVGGFFFIGSVILLISVWSSLPDKVPGHYNITGEITRWGHKGEMLILPIVSLFMLLLLTVLEKNPHIHNYPSRLNEQNAPQFYTLSRRLLNLVKNVCLVLFSIILFHTISVSMEWGIAALPLTIPITIVGILLPIVYTFFKMNKIQ